MDASRSTVAVTTGVHDRGASTASSKHGSVWAPIARRLMAVAVTALVPAACADMAAGFRVGPDRAAAQATKPVDVPFQAALYRGYMALAAEEEREGNYRSAVIFYRKAMQAAQGQSVALEDPAAWTQPTGLRAHGLGGSYLAEVQQVRPRLEAWIGDTKATDPASAAAQQVNFDCWVEELHEQEYAGAAACKPVFAAAVQAPPPAALPPPQTFTVLFDTDRSSITPEADRIIRAAADAWKRGRSPRVTVTGHTDSVGNQAYNQRLSERRSAEVKARLVQHGVAASSIGTVAKGESAPAVATPQDASEQRNRRVEILIQH